MAQLQIPHSARSIIRNLLRQWRNLRKQHTRAAIVIRVASLISHSYLATIFAPSPSLACNVMQNQIAININVFSGTPLTVQIAEEIKKLIAEGSLSRGDKLPSIREMARHCRVSIGTIRTSMKLLVDEKFLASHHGSGFFITAENSNGAQPTEHGMPVHQVSHKSEGQSRTRDTRFHQFKSQLSSFDGAAATLGIPLLRRHLQVFVRQTYGLDVDADLIAIFSNIERAKEVLKCLFSLPHLKHVALSVIRLGDPQAHHMSTQPDESRIYVISMAHAAEGMFVLLLPPKFARLIELTMQATGAHTPLIQQLLLLSHLRNEMPAVLKRDELISMATSYHSA